jgi:hypothetical protein
MDLPTMVPPLVELQQLQQEEDDYDVNATDLVHKDGAVATILVPLVLGRLDTPTLYNIDQTWIL